MSLTIGSTGIGLDVHGDEGEAQSPGEAPPRFLDEPGFGESSAPSVSAMIIETLPLGPGYELESLPPPPVYDQPELLPDAASSAFGLWGGELFVDEDGAANYRIPIDLPPGRAGMSPALALEYSSAAGLSHVGHGWRVGGLSEIYRCNHTMNRDQRVRAVRLDSEDVYCLDGNRLVEVSFDASARRRVFRTEIELQQKIEAELHATNDAIVEAFVVRQPSGLAYRYSIHVRTAASSIPFRYLLSRVTDPHGNYYSYEYERVDPPAHDLRAAPEELLRFVRYTANDGSQSAPLTAATKVVGFVYEDLPKAFRGFRHGTPIQITKRLRRVRIAYRTSATHAELVRSYELQYGDEALDGYSRLRSIAPCDGHGTCFPPLGFDYGPTSAGGYSEIAGLEVPPDTDAVMLMDIDGDGLDDLVWEPSGRQTLRVARNRWSASPSGFSFGPSTTAFTWMGNDVVGSPPFEMGYVVTDLDSDGRSDLRAYNEEFEGVCVNDDPQHGPPRRCEDYPVRLQSTGSAFDQLDRVLSYSVVGDGGGVDLADLFLAPGSIFTDIDGDGYGGPVRCHSEFGYVTPGHGSIGMFDWRCDDIPSWPSSLFHHDAGAPLAMDSDGDGASEILVYEGGQARRISVTGSWAEASRWESEPVSLPEAIVRSDIMQTIAADVNGDGNLDLVGAVEGNGSYQVFVWFNDGRDFVRASEAVFEFNLVEGVVSMPAPHLLAADVDADGSDELFVHSMSEHSLTWFGVKDDGTIDSWSMRTLPGVRVERVRVGNLDDNGVPDLLIYDGDDWRFFVDTGRKQTLLSTIRQNTSAPTHTIEYGTTADSDLYEGDLDAEHCRGRVPSTVTGGLSWSDGGLHPADDPHRLGQITGLQCLSTPMTVVARTWSDSGPEQAGRTIEYRYADGTIDRWGKGWLGFKRATRTEPAAGLTIETEYYVDRVLAGRVKKATTRVDLESLTDAQPEHYERIEEWGWEQRVEGGRTLIEPTFELASAYLKRSPAESTYPVSSVRTTYLDHDARGRPQRIVINRADGVLEQVSRSFLDDEARWILGLVASESVQRTDDRGVVQVQSVTHQWTHRGELEVTKVRPDGDPLQLRTELQYDPYGNLARRTATEIATGRARTEAWEYDAREHTYTSAHVVGDFPTLRSETAYHPFFGAPRAITSPDATAMLFRYDGFGRLVETQAADGSSTTTDYEAPPPGPSAVLRVTTAASDLLPHHVDLDRLGRPFAEVGYDYSGRPRASGASYDGFGRLIARSLSHAPNTSGPIERYAYDRLGRLQHHIQVDGVETFYAYHAGATAFGADPHRAIGQSVTVVNGRGFSQTTHRDPAGRTMRVDDALGFATLYRHGAAGLREVEDANGNLISIAFDDYGLRQWISDPDTGLTSWSYNAFGQPVLQTDNAGIQTTFTYDHLGRQERIEGTDPATGNVDVSQWTYGWTGPERGRLRSLRGPDGHRIDYSYSAAGQIAAEEYGFATGETFRFDYAYDAIGRLQYLAYPASSSGARPEIEYTYQNGLVRQVLDRASRYTYWTRLDTNGLNQTIGERFGSEQRGATRESSYLSWGGVDRRTVRDRDGVVLSDLATYWDSNRNLAGRIDHQQGVLEYFAYDPLDRLAESCFLGSVQPFYAEPAAWSPPSMPSLFAALDQTYASTAHRSFSMPWGPGEQEPENLASLTTSEMSIVRAVGTVQGDDFVMLNQAPRSQGYAACASQAYDALGNILFQSDVGTFAFSAGSNAVRSLTPANGPMRSFVHDARGAMTANGRETFTYTLAGHLRTVTSNGSGATTRFEYLTGGQRARKRSETDETLYAGALYQHRSTRGSGVVQSVHAGTLLSSHYFITVDGAAVAELQLFESDLAFDVPPPPEFAVSALYGKHAILFSFDDHAGSPILVTNHEGEEIESRSYSAFGRLRAGRWGPQGTPPGNRHRPIGYTGHEDDSESGLVNMVGRVYDPELGRFLSPDPTIPHPGYSQAYNRYAYVYNNPLTLTDPSGFEPVGISTTVGGTGGGGGGSGGGIGRNGGWGNQDLAERKPTPSSGQSRVRRSSNPRCNRPRARGAAPPTPTSFNLFNPRRDLHARLQLALSDLPPPMQMQINPGGVHPPGWREPMPELRARVHRAEQEAAIQRWLRLAPEERAALGPIAQTAATRPPPNPFGRRGSLKHQARIAEAEQRLNARGLETVSGGSLPEQAVNVGSGRVRFPDLVVRNAQGTTMAVQVGRTTMAGRPVARERRALKDLRNSGEFDHVFFLGY